MRIMVGSLERLQREGRLLTKAGAHGVCVFWHEGRAYAVDDRCPHLGFPLHRGSVEAGLLTCHWHHARFDLATGGTLDPFADDVRTYGVEVDGDDVWVLADGDADPVGHLHERLHEGLEQGLTLVTAKSVLGLLEAGVSPAEIVDAGVRYGARYRGPGWGAGLTVLVAMANLLPHLREADRPLALVHGLAFVARDTSGRAPRFALSPLPGRVDADRLALWYRRFVETRSADAAERTLLTAIAVDDTADNGRAEVADMMLAAATDHVFLDEGHTLDFTNKAWEALEHVGWKAAADVLPTLVGQTAAAHRHEEDGTWRHPHDLAGLVARTVEALPPAFGDGIDDDAVGRLGREVLADEPDDVVAALSRAVAAGATPEQLARGVALAAALRLTRFHVQNDVGDWDVVHHAFTHANALHRCMVRNPSPALVRGVVHAALRVYLDRFLNVPAARMPALGDADLAGLQACWDEQGHVDRAGAIAYWHVRRGGSVADLIAALGGALLAEDAEFHWFQTVEAAVAQHSAWPRGSEEGALILAGAARFLAAHTPTRRELPQVVRIATRLRRGEELFAEA